MKSELLQQQASIIPILGIKWSLIEPVSCSFRRKRMRPQHHHHVPSIVSINRNKGRERSRGSERERGLMKVMVLPPMACLTQRWAWCPLLSCHGGRRRYHRGRGLWRASQSQRAFHGEARSLSPIPRLSVSMPGQKTRHRGIRTTRFLPHEIHQNPKSNTCLY